MLVITILSCVLLFNMHVLAIYPDDCGQPDIPPHIPSLLEKIINGEEATPHSFPWQISIKVDKPEHYCGGSIISPYWVLTAAHCANIVYIGEYFGDVVVIGQHDRLVQTKKNSASADGGPRSRVCARETLRSAPHRHYRKFFGAHVWGGEIV